VAKESVERKLAAVLYADVAGYTRLTEIDEEGTHRRLGASLDLIAATVEAHTGRVIHYAGDAVLAEFASVLVALNAAVEIQEGLVEVNRAVPAGHQLRYRIGVNFGDIIVDRGDIYGDGVNIAARLESLAEPGGICVSAKVHDEVGNKTGLTFEDMGAQKVKNVAEPVHTFRVQMNAPFVPHEPEPTLRIARPNLGLWAASMAIMIIVALVVGLTWFGPDDPAPGLAVASKANMAFALPDKPSIAVLPLDNLSGDPAQAYFADGITEDIITTLSRISGLFVIARNSTFVYKGKPVKIQKVAEDLGVRYVLEGSVQRAGDTVRITAQLIDALSGQHIWAERYDRKLEDLFVVQDEITHKIALALQVKLTQGEQIRVWRKTTKSIAVWNDIAQGMDHMIRFDRADNMRARNLFEGAAAAEPANAMARTLIGWTHWMDAQNGWSVSAEQSIRQAFAEAEGALALDDSAPDVHALLGALLVIVGEYDAAVKAGEKAVALNVNHATNTALLGMILHNAGKADAAIAKIKTAMRLSPYYPNWFLVELAWAYLDAGRYQDATEAFSGYLEREQGAGSRALGHIGLALAQARFGRENNARAEIAKVLTAAPDFTARRFVTLSLSRDKAKLAQTKALLHRLGLPE